MKVTTIAYQRVLNLGDYNSCRLEKTALADEYEDQEIATQNLIESVERQIHDEHIQNRIDLEISGKSKQLALLKAEYAELSKQVELLKAQTSEEKEQDLVDDILFNAGSPTSNDPGRFLIENFKAIVSLARTRSQLIDCYLTRKKCMNP